MCGEEIIIDLKWTMGCVKCYSLCVFVFWCLWLIRRGELQAQLFGDKILWRLARTIYDTLTQVLNAHLVYYSDRETKKIDRKFPSSGYDVASVGNWLPVFRGSVVS